MATESKQVLPIKNQQKRVQPPSTALSNVINENFIPLPLVGLGSYLKGKTPYMCVKENIIVVKIGSNSLVCADGSTVDQNYLNSVAEQCNTLINKYNVKIVLVSSGACATGVGTIGLKERPAGAAEKQALAAIGQVSIIHNWEEAFSPFQLKCAQLLVTQRCFTDSKLSANLIDTIKVLFKWNIVPILNENDPIAVKEITVGDNDRLSALLSTHLGAHTLVLLTDIDGLYDADPRFNKNAKKLDVIQCVTQEMLDAAGGPGSKGRGGMRSKLESARFGALGGAQVVIANAKEKNVIHRAVVPQDNMGTRIMPAPRDPSVGTSLEKQREARLYQCISFLAEPDSKL